MNELVVHHQYAMGSTFDLSRHGNHGFPSDVAVGAGVYSSSYLFEEMNSRIVVLPSASLESPLSVAVMVRFKMDGSAPDQRQNLVEGYLSFALYVQPGGALAGTIVNSDGQWQGFTTNEGVVTPGIWHEAWLIHNGLCSIQLQLDGQVVGQSNDVVGPVRGVGNLGLSIGNWPDQGAYPFRGYIDEIKVYRYDPTPDLNRLISHCCFDGKRFDSALKTLNATGVLSPGSASGEEIITATFQAAATISQIRGPANPNIRGLWNTLLRRQPKDTRKALSSFVSTLQQTSNTSVLRMLERFYHLLQTHGFEEAPLTELSLALNKCAGEGTDSRKEIR